MLLGIIMFKRKLILPLLAAGSLIVACSDDAEDSPVSPDAIDPISVEPAIENPSLPGEGLSSASLSQGDSLTGSSTASDSTGMVPGSTAISDSSGGLTATVNGSSAMVPNSSAATPISSSSGLKEYNDNHLPKDSFLPKAGFYSSLTIEPLTPQKGGQIYCTFDGSFPTQSSEQISAPRAITQNTVVRCSEFVNGQAADTTTQTYFINESVSMPVVALTVNHHDMFDSTDGLYATGPLTNQGGQGMWNMGGGNVSDHNNPNCTEPCEAANYWKDTELPVHVEYFDQGSASTGKNWEIDAGISIIGNWSRYKPKKSVAIKMDNDIYGDKVLKYSFFKTRPEAKKIKSFNLRNNGNRYWTDYIGDAMMTSLMEGTDVDYQRSLQVVVFYNGEYFGIHDLRERLNRSFVETNYGIDSKSINMIKIKGSELEASGTNGSSVTEYQQLVNEIASGNFAGENNAQYEQLKSKINLNSFAQYMFAEMYFHNGDWPNNNVRAWGGNGYPFKFVAFDLDHGFGFTPGIQGFDVQNQNMFDWVLGQEQGDNQGGWNMGSWGMTANNTPGGMLKKLLENPDFKHMFINNACILLQDYLTYEKVQKTVQEMMATIPSSERSRDEQRWPRTESSFTWDPEGNNLVAYARTRGETVKQEMAARFGLQSEVTVAIGVSGSGKVQVDGMNLPRSDYQGNFFSGVDMTLTAVPAAGRIFSGWSDNVSDNPRKVTLNGNATFTAVFK